MNKEHEKWNEAIRIAKSLGASDEAVYKWGQRGGIPASWVMKIVLNSDGKITLEHFRVAA